jgi:UDP-3-O-[3-hydroxymyristoyl] N-acetylglucosamine deacetylase
MIAQRTLKAPARLEGVALHSGRFVKMALVPAAPGTGIVFVRTDLDGRPEIPAQFQHVVNTKLATTLGIGKVTLCTVEHLMAALQGMGIDNLKIEIDGPEVPILDGSAAPFCRAIQEVGIQSQALAKSFLALRRRVEIRSGETFASAEPSAKLEILGSIAWDHPMIGTQEFHYIEGDTPFSELSSARTFGFLKDVEGLKRMGLALGGSLENAVVLDETSVLSPGGLRYPDEFVRHKILDALGDFKLAGIGIHGFIRLHRAGHDLHRQLLAEIFRNPDNYEIIDASGDRRTAAVPVTTLAARSWAAV